MIRDYILPLGKRSKGCSRIFCDLLLANTGREDDLGLLNDSVLI